MKDFITTDPAAAALLQETPEAESYPDPAPWEELAAPFRARGEDESARGVTVDVKTPLSAYGEELPFLRRFLRRVLRRCLRWYLEPMVQQQNRINRQLAGEVERLRERIRTLEEQGKA